MFKGITLNIFKFPGWETSYFLIVMMYKPRHFLSNFLTFWTFSAYPSYKLHSYKKRVYCQGPRFIFLAPDILNKLEETWKTWKKTAKNFEQPMAVEDFFLVFNIYHPHQKFMGPPISTNYQRNFNVSNCIYCTF